MDDAISRSAVLDRLEMLRWNYGLKAGYRDAMTDAIGEVSNALTVDAVPVVRCKDCKHWGMLEGPPETESVKCCEFGQYMVGANGYCVYGEVEEHD